MSAPTLFVLAADLTKMQVLASLDESDVGRIRPGQAVRFRVDAFPTDEFIGQRDAGSPAADDGAERRDLSDGHRRAEPRLEAEARDDGEREHRDRAARRCDPRAEHGAAVPADGRDVHRARTDTAAWRAAAAADVAPAAVPTRATRSRLQRAPRSTGGAAQPPANAAGDSAAPQLRTAAPHRRERHGAGCGTQATARAADGPRRGRRRRAPRRTRQFRRAHGEHDARRARAFHGAHARTRLHSSGRRADAAARQQRGGRGQGPAQQGQRRPPGPRRLRASGATTFDALFGPLTQTETFGQVWLNVETSCSACGCDWASPTVSRPN